MSELTLYEERLPTPIGEAIVLCDDAGNVRALDWQDYEARCHRLLRRHYGEGFSIRPARRASGAARALMAYFDGDVDALDAVPVACGGSAFQREVWTALRTIPIGHRISYGALATMIGRPSAARAVGLANGANPVAVIVPCHRVIAANAALTGYAGGLARKRWLLEHEARILGEELPELVSTPRAPRPLRVQAEANAA